MKRNIIKLPNNKYINMDSINEFYIIHKVVRPNDKYEYNSYEMVLNGGLYCRMNFDDRKYGGNIKDYYILKDMICKYLEIDDMEAIEN